ncbi:hypothetical protein [Fibrella arboris]
MATTLLNTNNVANGFTPFVVLGVTSHAGQFPVNGNQPRQS